MTVGHLRVTRGNHRLNIGQFRSPYWSILVGKGYLIAYGHRSVMVEYWRGNWTVSDVTGHAGETGRYLANAIISDKSK